MPVQSTFYARVFALAVAALLIYALLRIFLPFAGPIAWAAFLAFLLFPLNLRLRRAFRGRSALAAGLLTVLAPIVMLLPMSRAVDRVRLADLGAAAANCRRRPRGSTSRATPICSNFR